MRKTIPILIFLFSAAILTGRSWVKLGPSAGVFLPSDKTLQELYGEYDLTYGLNLGLNIWQGIFFYVSGNQYQGTAETTFTGDIARLILNPIEFSVRYTMPLGTLNPYLQAGYTHILFKEESDIGVTKDSANGYFLGTGVEFRLSGHFFIDFGVKYSQAKITIDVAENVQEEFDLGGFQAAFSFLVFL